MAAGIPQEKAEQYIKEFSSKLESGKTIDPFTYRKLKAELSARNSSATIVALGYLEWLSGNEKEAIEIFSLSLEVNDFFLAQHFYQLLRVTSNYLILKDYATNLAGRYPSKMFSQIAYSNAYRFGDRESLIHFFDQHIKLLSDNEGRQNAMKHKEELLSELDGIYDSSQCNRNQFEAFATVIWSVVEEYKALAGYVQLSERGNGCYIVDIKNKSVNDIAKMNFLLAEKVCDDELLDDCKLVARFSSPRKLHTGVSYASEQQ